MIKKFKEALKRQYVESSFYYDWAKYEYETAKFFQGKDGALPRDDETLQKSVFDIASEKAHANGGWLVRWLTK